jgi:hypothetical protein
MIAIQLADLLHGQSDPPSNELTQRYKRATTAVSNCFTVKVSKEDEAYLYIRFKKIKNDTGLILQRALIIYIFRAVRVD